MDEDAVAGAGHPLRQRLHALERPPPAGRERDPRPLAANDFVMDADTAHVRYGHALAPIMEKQAW
jgi:hypothetical protein